jgi:UDP-N-acetylmuramyl pentapeptide synthase
MKELGQQSREAHRRIGGEAAGCDFQALFLFGEEMESAYRELRSRGFQGILVWETEIESLRGSLSSNLREGDLLLVKGSRAAELERIVPESGEG